MLCIAPQADLGDMHSQLLVHGTCWQCLGIRNCRGEDASLQPCLEEGAESQMQNYRALLSPGKPY
jgi:hypothetical protein